MRCMFCQHDDSKVIDSRVNEDGKTTRRRRECLKCGRRFTTYETIETTPVLVIKSNGSRQPFSKEKIKVGLIKACEKRSVSLYQIDKMCDNIEKQIQNTLKQEVQACEIGEMVMEELKKTDEVAYIRFASVYRKFKDVSNFVTFLSDFEEMIKK